MADLIILTPDPMKPLKAPRTRQERHPLSNKGWRWSHLIVALLVFFAVLFTAALGEWAATKTFVPLEVTSIQNGVSNAYQGTSN